MKFPEGIHNQNGKNVTGNNSGSVGPEGVLMPTEGQVL